MAASRCALACRTLADLDATDAVEKLVWALEDPTPEVSQAALNHLVRAVHVVLHAHGEPAHMAERPVRDNAALRAAPPISGMEGFMGFG